MINSQIVHPDTGVVLFTEKELSCRETGVIKLAEGFEDHLLDYRITYNRPMPATSICRSGPYNTAVGGEPGSFHICDTTKTFRITNGCCAIDWVMPADPAVRGEAIKLALNKGWRVGLNWQKNFIHMDRGPDWGYVPVTVFPY